MHNYNKHARWYLLVFGGVVFYWLIWVWNPLPSDEQMIEHFKANRADFEEAVHRYKNYPRGPDKDISFWYKDSDTLEIFKRAKIDHISETIHRWYPNPYSVETAKKVHADSLRAKDLLSIYRPNALTIKPATTPKADHPNQSDSSSYQRISWLRGVYWKDYSYFPEAPRIENGMLMFPFQIVGRGHPGSVYYESEGVAISQTKRRVLPSLNGYPDNWKDYECVYRQIEPQWFLSMCNGH